MRHPLVWVTGKLNGSTQMVNDPSLLVCNELSSVDGCDVVAPPVIYLTQAKHALAGSRIALGAQNVDVNYQGAFTGETSVEMLDVGAKHHRPTERVLITTKVMNLSLRNLLS